MARARGEQETILRRDVDGWHAWSDIPSDILTFKKQGWTQVREDGKANSCYFVAPDHAVSIRSAEKRQKKALTDEQKKVLSDRMRNLRKPTQSDEENG